jgi:hypothetical protein
MITDKLVSIPCRQQHQPQKPQTHILHPVTQILNTFPPGCNQAAQHLPYREYLGGMSMTGMFLGLASSSLDASGGEI